jgi:ppGpp synthetase/RelA/SpoT-type nucleotidyltranferase
MTNTVLHVHGQDSQEVRDLVERLRKAGYDAYHCVCRSLDTPIVRSENFEDFRGEDIQRTFFPS